VIKTNRFNKVAKDTLDEWIYFLKTAEIKDEFTAKGLKSASQKLDILKLDPADRKEYDRYMEAQHFVPAATYAYVVAYNTLEQKRAM